MDAENTKTLGELTKRIGELEKLVFKSTVYGTAAGIVVTSLFGISVWQLPRAAKDAATEKLPLLVAIEADRQLPKEVERQVRERLPKLVNETANQMIPTFVNERAVPELRKEMTKQLTAIIAQESAAVEKAKNHMLDQYISVLSRAEKAGSELDVLEIRSEETSATAQKLEDQSAKLTDDIARLGELLKGIEVSKEVDIAKLIEQLESAPDAKKLLAEIGRSWSSMALKKGWRNKQTFTDPIPKELLHVTDLDLKVNSSGRPLFLSFAGGSIGLDVGPAPRQVEGGVLVKIQIMRAAPDGKTMVVGTCTFQSDSSRVIVPVSCLQVVDENPPRGDCVYSVHVSTVRGMGIFYFDAGVRMLATAF